MLDIIHKKKKKKNWDINYFYYDRKTSCEKGSSDWKKRASKDADMVFPLEKCRARRSNF
jgi:hypothetical protein